MHAAGLEVYPCVDAIRLGQIPPNLLPRIEPLILENQTRPVSGTAQRAAMPLNHSHAIWDDLRLTGEVRLRYFFLRRDKLKSESPCDTPCAQRE
jgi:hypothetical protein